MTTRSARDVTAVAIVGAGPVGLSLALGLAREGVPTVLLERDEATSEESRAPAIHIRTREIFRQWGVEQRLLDAGVLRQRLGIHTAGTRGTRRLVTYDFCDLEPEAHLPGLLILEQGRTESLLLDAVRETGLCDIRFGAEVTGLSVDGDLVHLTVREAGAPRTVTARFAVGCDGASSSVREALGLPFEGITYSVRPMMADVRVEDDRDALPWPRVRNRQGSLTAAARLAPGLWRIIRLERDRDLPEAVPATEVRRRVDEVLGQGDADIVWANRFRIHRRSAPRFRAGRVLLAGDAAHVHSPVGGQGMNAGIGDAHNLAWKLARALAGGDVDRLLDSYDVERRAVVVGSVSRVTGVVTRAVLETPSAIRVAALGLTRLALAVPALRRRALRRLSMLDLAYPASPLLDGHERSAGVRLPDPGLRDAGGRRVRLHDLVGNRATLLEVAGEFDPRERRAVDAVRISGTVRFRGASDRDGSVFRDHSGRLRALLGGSDGWILVRPDMHVAWARRRQDATGIDAAVRYALGDAGTSDIGLTTRSMPSTP